MKTPAVRLKARIRWSFHRRGQPADGYHGPHGRGGTPCLIGGGVECGCRTVLLPSRGPSTFAEEPVMARSPRDATAAAVSAARNEARQRMRPDWKRPRRSCWTIRLNDGLDVPRGLAHDGDRGPPTDGQDEYCEIGVCCTDPSYHSHCEAAPAIRRCRLRTGHWEPVHDDDGGASFNRKYKSTDPKLDWCTCAHAGSERPAWATSAGCWKVAERERYGWTRIL